MKWDVPQHYHDKIDTVVPETDLLKMTLKRFEMQVSEYTNILPLSDRLLIKLSRIMNCLQKIVKIDPEKVDGCMFELTESLNTLMTAYNDSYLFSPYTTKLYENAKDEFAFLLNKLIYTDLVEYHLDEDDDEEIKEDIN